MGERKVTIERNTKETKIRLTLNLDGTGQCVCRTGLGFFDHMIDAFTRHSLLDINLVCEGDLEVDAHHSVEDVGIVLGQAIKEALGGKEGIKRYGNCILPMDEALVLAAVDLSGRPCFVSDMAFSVPKIGDMDAELMRDFFYALSYAAGMNLHLKQLAGENNHHIAEACFKAFAKALCMAVSFEPRVEGVWSTKGLL